MRAPSIQISDTAQCDQSRRWRLRHCVGAVLFLPLGAGWTEAPLSTLNPAGPAAESIAVLWWVMFWGSMAVTALMIGLALYVGLRNPDRRSAVPSRLLIIGGGFFLPFVVITGLLVYGLPRGQALLAGSSPEDAFEVHITGHQWWWEVRYPDFKGDEIHDANEIHLPVNRPVHFRVTTNDVIHSFWIPRLGGKIDAIPGISNELRLQADRPGVYRGTCAEFCGVQHAHMGLIAEAHEEDALEERLGALAARRLPDVVTPGAEAFHLHCSSCHSLDSRSPAPLAAPNLAGVLERRSLGAGLIPNGKGAIERWIRDHNALKPGNYMPDMSYLADETIDQIVQFLEQER